MFSYSAELAGLLSGGGGDSELVTVGNRPTPALPAVIGEALPAG